MKHGSDVHIAKLMCSIRLMSTFWKQHLQLRSLDIDYCLCADKIRQVQCGTNRSDMSGFALHPGECGHE